MKKTTLILVIIFFTTISFSQNTMTWFSIGVRGGFGTSMLINVPSLDDSKIDYSYFSPSYYYGGRFGLMFGDYVGVSAEVSMNSLAQGYSVHGTELMERFMRINTFDFGFLLNLETETGFYFEVGPKFSTIKSANLTNTGDNINALFDRTDKFTPEFTSLMFGIGMKPVMTDVFEMKIGLRGAYNFGNIVGQSGYIIPADDQVIYAPSYIDETTNPAQLMLSVEFTYVFGRFGKASCGKYRFLFNN